MRVRVIANPVAGGGRGKTMAEALCRALQGKVDDVTLVLTRKAGDNKVEASKPGADCVVAVGGDGSVNEVVNGLKDTDSTLAVLPAGTANVVARELKIPPDPQAVAALIVDQQLRWMDVGLHGTQRFLLGAGAGFDAAVVKAVSSQRGGKSSFFKWVAPTLNTVRTYSFPSFRVIADGEEVTRTVQYAIVGICRYSAGVLPTTPKAKIDDGLLDLCLYHELSFTRLLRLLATVWNPNHINRGDITYLQCRSVDFQPLSNEEVPLQVDGDPAGSIPAKFTILPKAVQVVAPTG